MANAKYVIIPSQFENDLFYVRTSPGTHSDQDLAEVRIIQKNGISHMPDVQDFIEELFKPVIPLWFR